MWQDTNHRASISTHITMTLLSSRLQFGGGGAQALKRKSSFILFGDAEHMLSDGKAKFMLYVGSALPSAPFENDLV